MRPLIYLCIACVLGLSTVAAQDADIPYIYYHSEALNAIVIERADGSDSRAIARGVMPVDHDYVSMVGWSPSGEWLAWTSAHDTEYNHGPKRIWVMSADGQQRLTFLDSLEDVWHVSWSPTGDYLLIMGWQRRFEQTHHIIVVDVLQQRIVAEFEEASFEVGDFPNFWSDDGNSVQLPMPGPTVSVVYIDGRIEDNVPADERPPRSPAEPPTYEPETISPDGNYELIRNDYNFPTQQIRNKVTGEIVEFRPYSGISAGICDLDWYPGGGWLLVTFDKTPAGGSCNWTGMTIINMAATVQRELGPCNIHFPDECAKWLPERVVAHLSLGQPTSIVPEPALTLEHDTLVYAVGWHPDGVRLAAFIERRPDVGGNNEYTLNIWDTDAVPPVIVQTFPVGECNAAWWTQCKTVWNDAGTQIALAGWLGTQIYDATTGDLLLETDDYLIGFAEDNTPMLVEGTPMADYDPVSGLAVRADWQVETISVYVQSDGNVLFQSGTDGDAYRIRYTVTLIPGGEYVAFVGNADEPVQGNFLWTLDTGEVDVLPKYALEFLTAMEAFDSDTIIGYGDGSLLYFWDVATRDVAARLNRYVRAVDVSPDGTRMATGAGYLVEIWDYTTIIDQLNGR